MISSAVGALARLAGPFLAVAAIVGGGLQSVESPAVRLVDESNPLAGKPFYVDPISNAVRAAKSTPELAAIANTPTAYWLDEAFPAGKATSTVARIAGSAQAAGSMPVFALYAIPHRDCGSFAAGGFATAAGYKQWIDAIASGLGSMPAAFILEPDALDMADCLPADQRQERFSLIRYAVDTLTANPAAVVYIDGGHSRWLPAEEIANRLNQVGISKARGFSLNTSNFYTTAEQIGYGEAVSALTGGSHYVIDTGRNGAGPAPESPLNWCNPSGRALGVAPTTNTAGAHADAYLWVKRPGESDGSCNRGEPYAGSFVNSYAIELVRNAGR